MYFQESPWPNCASECNIVVTILIEVWRRGMMFLKMCGLYLRFRRCFVLFYVIGNFFIDPLFALRVEIKEPAQKKNTIKIIIKINRLKTSAERKKIAMTSKYLCLTVSVRRRGAIIILSLSFVRKCKKMTNKNTKNYSQAKKMRKLRITNTLLSRDFHIAYLIFGNWIS